MTAYNATRQSAGIRFDRAVARASVERGVSLAVLIREERAELQGVRLLTLVRWVPGIGPSKADRILLGLPQYYKLREITREQHAMLTERLAAAERSLLMRDLTTTKEFS